MAARKKYEGVLANRLVREFLVNLAGENALSVAAEATESMSDEDLARVCKLKVSDVRAVLNKLHYEGIASYERLRDKESGWYSYIWTVNLEKIPQLLEERRRREAEEAKARLAMETAVDFYSCKKCGRKEKYTFEQAADLLFKCGKCGRVLTLHDNSKEIRQLERKAGLA
ncbi:MAG: transcription factor [Candidatus Micrarchaeia archaeon]